MSHPAAVIYTPQDLRNLELVLLQKLDKFNDEYSKYKKYLFNIRHNVAGDTTPQFYNSNNTPISTTDFPDLDIDRPIDISPIYMDLENTINQFNEMLLHFKTQPLLKANASVDELAKSEKMVQSLRSSLDKKLEELNEFEHSFYDESKRRLNANIMINILWTTLATSLIYFIIVRRK